METNQHTSIYCNRILSKNQKVDVEQAFLLLWDIHQTILVFTKRIWVTHGKCELTINGMNPQIILKGQTESIGWCRISFWAKQKTSNHGFECCDVHVQISKPQWFSLFSKGESCLTSIFMVLWVHFLSERIHQWNPVTTTCPTQHTIMETAQLLINYRYNTCTYTEQDGQQT